MASRPIFSKRLLMNFPPWLRGEPEREWVQIALPRILVKLESATVNVSTSSSNRMPPELLLRPLALREPLSFTVM